MVSSRIISKITLKSPFFDNFWLTLVTIFSWARSSRLLYNWISSLKVYLYFSSDFFTPKKVVKVISMGKGRFWWNLHHPAKSLSLFLVLNSVGGLTFSLPLTFHKCAEFSSLFPLFSKTERRLLFTLTIKFHITLCDVYLASHKNVFIERNRLSPENFSS